MGKSAPSIPDPGKAAVAGIRADTELQPFKYLIEAASAMGVPITLDGKTYDFSGLGNADTARTVSDKMAQTLLDLQREKSPQIIAQRLEELKAADPQGYAARKQLFDRILADAQARPDRPLSEELQKQLQAELAKGTGFSDARQAEQVREASRGGAVQRGIYLGNAPVAKEARDVVRAGESLRNTREQSALDMLQSGISPEDVAYRRMQQSLGNLASFQRGETPSAQFGQVSGAAQGPVKLTGQSPSGNQFNPNAAGQGLNNALGIYQGQVDWSNSQVNPWLAGATITNTAAGTAFQLNPQWQNYMGTGGVGP